MDKGIFPGGLRGLVKFFKIVRGLLRKGGMTNLEFFLGGLLKER